MRVFGYLGIAVGLLLAAPAVAQQATVAPPQATVAAPAAPTANATVAAPAELRPVQGVGQPVEFGTGLQTQVTDNGLFAEWFHNVILMPLITFICLFVLGLILWVVLKYRRSANPTPSRTSHHTLIEVIWTLVPVLILVAIAIPSIGLLARQYKPVEAGALTVKAIGNQWYWQYEYPDNGGFEIVSNMLSDEQAKAKGEPRLLGVDNRMVLPVGVPIRLLTTSNDVIHSWAMPAFWAKMDAVPGRINETSFTIDKPGVYYGQCSELCGARHAYMPIAVEAVPPAQFAQWVLSKGGTPSKGNRPADTQPQGQQNPPIAPGAQGRDGAEAAPAVEAPTASSNRGTANSKGPNP